jgi:hypothetical protein
MTTREMIAEWLRAHGYDGLCCDECGCLVDNIAPCELWGNAFECKPGYRCPCDCGEHDWHVGEAK